ncbi:MAG: ribonuclease domain-containing protein [Betaproteobacteria bacterium]
MRRTMRFLSAVLVAVSLLPQAAWVKGELLPAPATAQPTPPEIAVGELPREARETLARIDNGGPFPYERDGVVFGNFEQRLPIRERGYYREYTVRTPGVKHRGARRIVAGRNGERYYTEDHYRSFRRIRP